MEILYGDTLLGWAQDRNDVPLVPPVNAEISFIGRKNDVSRVQFTRSD
jgi:hypothetical protein